MDLIDFNQRNCPSQVSIGYRRWLAVLIIINAAAEAAAAAAAAAGA